MVMGEELFNLIWLWGALGLSFSWIAYGAYLIGAEKDGLHPVIWFMILWALAAWPISLGLLIAGLVFCLPFAPFWYIGKRLRTDTDTGGRDG
jgi:hypothetical protein